MTKKIEISQKSIVFTIFFLILLGFLYFIKDLIFELFVAVLIMTMLDPAVSKLVALRIPRPLGVLFVFVVLIAGLVFLGAGLAPPLIEQSGHFVNGLPEYIESLGLTSYVGDKGVEDFLAQIGVLPATAAKLALSIFSNLLEVLTVLIFAFYLLVSRDRLNDHVSSFFEDRKKEKILRIINSLETKLGSWVRGQLTLMFLIGALTYVGLLLLGVPFALPLAILAGLLEIIPIVGPIIAAVPAVIIGFGTSPVIGLATAALAFLIQQLENYVFVPTVMEKSLGLNPLFVLLALSIGFKLAGVVGAIVAIPAVLTIQVLNKELLFKKEAL